MNAPKLDTKINVADLVKFVGIAVGFGLTLGRLNAVDDKVTAVYTRIEVMDARLWELRGGGGTSAIDFTPGVCLDGGLYVHLTGGVL